MLEGPVHKDDFDGNLVFGNKRFHQETNRQDTIEDVTTAEWGHQFFDIVDGVLRPKEALFELIDHCPCCSSENVSLKFTVRGLGIYECADCSFGFQNPRIKAKHVSDIYAERYVMDRVYGSDMAMQLDRKKFLYGLQCVSACRDQIDTALDVGCGTGFSLDVYEEYGVGKAIGIEPGEYEAGSDTDTRISYDFMTVVPAQYQDLSLITLWDTLEHIHDFHLMLESAYRALIPGGVLLIMVPNFRSLATRLIKEDSPTFQIDHISYFSEKSLTRAIESKGFQMKRLETVISEIDNCRNYLEFKEPYFSTPAGEPAFDWLTADYIHSNMLGSRLLAVAQK